MNANNQCILVVGSTGTGKSTMIGMCTEQTVRTSSNTNECTLEIELFRDTEGYAWIDSVGFDGTDSTRSDEEAFQYILRFLQEKRISHVVGIIWTINPDDREAARLQEQAKLINKFKEGQVWNNVIIAVKKSRGNARNDGAGALAAAGRFCDRESLRAIGYALLEELDDNEKSFWSNQTQENRMRMGIFTKEEATTLIKDTLQTLPQAFQVVFRNHKCVDCGVESDLRLLPLFCHVLKEKIHQELAEPFHPLSTVLRHAANEPVLKHTGKVETTEEGGGKDARGPIKEIAAGITAGVAVGSFIPAVGAAIPAIVDFLGNKEPPKVVVFWSCCNKSVDSEGCASQYPCCDQPVTSQGCQLVFQCCSSLSDSNPGCGRRFPCCGGEENAAGCREQCSYCKVAWGSFDSNTSCIGRTHNNVIRLE